MEQASVLRTVENPILRQEVLRRARHQSFWTRWEGPISILIAGLCVGLTLASLSEVTITLAQGNNRGRFFISTTTLTVAQTTSWILFLAMTLRGMMAGVYSIHHEFMTQTWEALVLSNMSLRQILFGKWRAALRRVGPWMVALGLARLLLLPITSAAVLIPFYASALYRLQACTGSNCNSGFYNADPSVTLPLETIILAPVLVVILTILEALASTILGMAMAMLIKRNVVSLVAALGIRFIPLLTIGGLTNPIRLRFNPNFAFYSRAWSSIFFALTDGGMGSITRMLTPQSSLYVDRLYNSLLDPLLAVLALSAIIVGSWGLTRLLLRYSGAL
ncbi:MAG TPA: hypothetical protein VMT34_02175 [Aggregatilineales bacterium]|nr:hypothetical protein [Aggregatilineales bacterium]